MQLYIMFLFSLLAGFLSTMNIFAYRYDDVRFHINDVYMVILMSLWMILFMLLYDNKQKYFYFKFFLILFSIAIIVILIRTQTFVSDTQFLKGMIPHHSMAITMSEKIKDKTKNPIVKQLANDIIVSQNKEIQLMNDLLGRDDL